MREIIDDAVLRRMRILKLRGCSIDQPEYLFTLKDGIFRVFEPFSYEPPEKPRLFQPLDDPDENHFSSGSRSLDEIFQRGFPKGSSILFEVGRGSRDFGLVVHRWETVRDALPYIDVIIVMKSGSFVGNSFKVGEEAEMFRFAGKLAKNLRSTTIL